MVKQQRRYVQIINQKLMKELKRKSGFICNNFSQHHITSQCIGRMEMKETIIDWQHKLPEFFKMKNKDVNKSYCYVKVEYLCIYQFCEKVRRQNATMMQLWSNFFINMAIYDVKSSWRQFIITSKGRIFRYLVLEKEG